MPDGFNEAAGKSPRNRSRTAASQPCSSGFNEAAGKSPRNHDHVLAVLVLRRQLQ